MDEFTATNFANRLTLLSYHEIQGVTRPQGNQFLLNQRKFPIAVE